MYGTGSRARPVWIVQLRRRLEDRIRELCAEALITQGSQIEQALSDLQAALREHIRRLREFANAKLVSPREKDGQTKDRRCA
jgi:hypothetical protein